LELRNAGAGDGQLDEVIGIKYNTLLASG
jgi:hypothetical protein